MKSKLNIGFLTTCSGRWPRELPVKREAEYGAWLEEEIKSPWRLRQKGSGKPVQM